MQSDEKLLKIISANLSMLKDEHGYSIRDLADITGDSPMTLFNTLSGKHMPRSGVLIRMAEAFRVSVDSLLEPMPATRGSKRVRVP